LEEAERGEERYAEQELSWWTWREGDERRGAREAKRVAPGEADGDRREANAIRTFKCEPDKLSVWRGA
jgi:hypothetical protein